ncbi:HAMP domain-containing histidine kinase [Cytophaga aurantiaca]|uniref:HAMP domain-containing histidine kinase n=1 Tax=Cytophaga aurantiaca TaxID=29530 RepID=UPI000364E317|nr:HAMP domain-containing histidine kinase [Cytophaga aurantiaca]
MTEKRIEDFFLKTILRISFVGVLLIVAVDLLFMSSDDFLGFGGLVDIGILTSIAIGMVLHKWGYYFLALIIPLSFSALALLGISIAYSQSITTAMIALVVVGFSISILLKSAIKNWIHAFIYTGMFIVSIYHISNISFYKYDNVNQVIINFTAYFMVYLIITCSAGTLKNKYDSITLELKEKNIKLLEQTVLMVHQNNELVESRNELNEINQNLESIVEQRTNNVKQKNEYLIKYAYTNAHHVRGPLARILGLLQLAKLDGETDYLFLFDKIDYEAKEIDVVLKTINKELEEGQDVFF